MFIDPHNLNFRAARVMLRAIKFLRAPGVFRCPDSLFTIGWDAEGHEITQSDLRPFTGHSLRELLLGEVDPELERRRTRKIETPARMSPYGALMWAIRVEGLDEMSVSFRIDIPGLARTYALDSAVKVLRTACEALCRRSGWPFGEVQDLCA